MELNLADYIDPEAMEDPENTLYELKTILIHSGGAYGGHYHAYVLFICKVYSLIIDLRWVERRKLVLVNARTVLNWT